MIDYHGKIVHAGDSTTRGRLVINALSSLTTDAVDVTDDDNFHVILKSHAHISSVETAGNGHFQTKSDTVFSVDVFPGDSLKDDPSHDTTRCSDMP